VSPEAYGQHLADLNALCVDRVAPRDTKGHYDADHFQAQQRIVEAAISVLDCDSLIRLHPCLTGNSNLRILLQSLDLPLEKLRQYTNELDEVQNKSKEQRQRQSMIEELLDWLGRPEPCNPLPDVSDYSVTAARSRSDGFMRPEANQAGRSTQDNTDLIQHVRKHTPVVMASSSDLVRQSQHRPEGYDQTTAAPQAELREQIKLLSAQISSLKGAETPPQPNPAYIAPKATAEPSSHGTATVFSAQEQVVASQEQVTRSPKEEAAFIEARAQPHRKAVAHAALQYPEKLAKYVKLQTWGEAYNIIIDELVQAANGGPLPTHFADLLMPDADSCYYRLQYLWKKLGKILYDLSDFDALRTNVDKFYEFAICMREAHCLFRAVSFPCRIFADVLATGWSLEEMRLLQSMMVDYVHEEPLIWSKRDVDAICTALHEATEMHAENGKLILLAAGSAAQNASSRVPDEPCNNNSVLGQQQASNDENARYGLPILRPLQPVHSHSTAGNPIGQIQNPVPFLQIPNTNSEPDVMEIDNDSVAITYQHQLGAASLSDASHIEQYCKNWTESKCYDNRCNRIYDNAVPELRAAAEASEVPMTSAPTKPQMHPQSQFRAGKASTYCKFVANNSCRDANNCRFSHDPALAPRSMQQPIGDIAMGGAALNGPNCVLPAALARRQNYNIECMHEQNGQFCKSNQCMYKHFDMRSKNFGSKGTHPRPRNNQIRAPNDYTFNASHMNNLGSVLPSQTQQGQRLQHSQTRRHGKDNQVDRPPPQCYTCGQFGHKSNRCQQPSGTGITNRQSGNHRGNNHGGRQRNLDQGRG